MKAIYEKLARIQLFLKAPKSQYNKFNDFNYRSAEDIYESVKPLLDKWGLYLTLSDTLEAIGERYYIKATATLTDGTDTITVTAYAREDENRAGMSESQVTGCSSSYARKYALGGLFLIDDGKDSDSYDNRKNVENKGLSTINKTKTNKEVLKDFCTKQGLECPACQPEIKRFYKYYKKKLEKWSGEFNVEKCWENWQINKNKYNNN